MSRPHTTDGEVPPASRGGRLARIWRGVRLGFPIFLGYTPVGIAFGIVAHAAGFSPFAAVTCSALAIAGAGQFIGVAGLASGAGPAAALFATSVVNLRYVLFGSTLSPHLKNTRLRTQAFLAFTLTDETFAVNVADIRAGTATPASMAGVGIIAWLGWVIGTAVGVLGAGLIGDPGKWGVDFAMPAMFTALFIALADDWRHVVAGLVAATVALCLPLFASAGIALPASWYVVIASMAAATVATAVFRDSE